MAREDPLLDSFVKSVVGLVGGDRGVQEARTELVRVLREKAMAEADVDRLEDREESLRIDIHELERRGHK